MTVYRAYRVKYLDVYDIMSALAFFLHSCQCFRSAVCVCGVLGASPAKPSDNCALVHDRVSYGHQDTQPDPAHCACQVMGKQRGTAKSPNGGSPVRAPPK